MAEMIEIPRKEYERLRSNAEDMAAVARHLSNPEESVPAEFVNRMLAGESLLKLWREHRGLTGVALAELSGVNRVQIVNIESGKSTGSVLTLKKLAEALGLKIDDLV